jgi:hypothetical protein
MWATTPAPMIATMARMARQQASGHLGEHEVPEVTIWQWFLLLNLLFWPRLFFVGFLIFDRQIGDAYSGWVVPALGFIFLPWTTVFYAFMWGASSDAVHGAEWIVVGIALLFDVWTYGLMQRLFGRG